MKVTLPGTPGKCSLFQVSGRVKSQDYCFQNGECRDSFHIGGKPASNQYKCLEFCNLEPDCAWFTYFPSTNYCELLQTCTTLDIEACGDCVTGQKDCTPGLNYINHIFIPLSRKPKKQKTLQWRAYTLGSLFFVYFRCHPLITKGSQAS
jgi:hypothetical protein